MFVLKCSFKQYLWAGVMLILAACGANTSSPDSSAEGLRELAQAADAQGNLEATITATVRRSSANQNLSTASTGLVKPVLLEVEATTPGGKPFKAVLVGSSQDALATGFSGPLRIRAKKTEIRGETVIAGYAALPGASGPATSSFRGFAFLAVKQGVTLPGPEVGAVYNMDGKAELRGFCADGHLTGAALFKNRLETVKVVNATLALLNNRLPCTNGQQVAAEVRMNFEAEVVNTHLGKVLSSYGVMEVERGGESFTLPLFTIGVPEALSERVKQQRFNNNKIAPNVFVLTPFFMSEIEDIARGTFRMRSLPEGFQNLKVGDILVSRPFGRLPDGMLRKVTEVETSSQGVSVRTTAIKLEEALHEGEITFRRAITAEDLTEDVVGAEGVDFSAFNNISALRSQAVSAQKLDLLPRVNINKTIVGNIRLEGHLDLGVEPVFEFICRKAFCAELRVVGKFVVTEEAKLALVGSHGLSYSKTIPLGPPLPLGTYVIFVGFPLTITPTISFDATLTADGRVDINVTATQSLELEVGVEKDFGEGFKAVSKLTRSQSFSQEYSGSFEATARAAVRGSITVLGTLTAYADFGPYIEFEAKYPGNPLWELRGGINSFAGLAYNLLIASDDVSFEVFKREWTIAAAPNTKPEIVDFEVEGSRLTGIGLGEGFPSGRPITFRASANDDQDGSNCCSLNWAVLREGEGTVASRTTSGANQSFTFANPFNGRYTLIVNTTDSQGLPTSYNYSFTVGSGESILPPTFESFIRRPGGSLEVGQEVVFTTQVTHPTNPCCTLNWYVDNVLRGTTTGTPITGGTFHTFRYTFPSDALVPQTGSRTVRAETSGFNGTQGSRSETFSVIRSTPANRPPELTRLYLYQPSAGNPKVGEVTLIGAEFTDDSDVSGSRGCSACTLVFTDITQVGAFNTFATLTPPYTAALGSITFTKGGLKTIRVRATDGGGVVTEATFAFNVDRAGPW